MCQPGTQDEELYAGLRNGIRLDLLGQRWAAVRHLEILLNEHPSFHEARGHLAWIYSLQGNNSAGIQQLKELVSLDPKRTEVADRIEKLEQETDWLESGAIDRNEAFEMASRLAAQSSRDPRATQRDALVLFRALWESGSNPETTVWVSRLSFLLQDYRTCLKATEESLARTPRDFELLTRLGLLHEILGNHTEAADAYRKALDSKPKAMGVLANLICLGEETPYSFPQQHPLAEVLASTGQSPPEGAVIRSGAPWCRDSPPLPLLGNGSKHCRRTCVRIPGLKMSLAIFAGAGISLESRSDARMDGRSSGVRHVD